MKLCIAQATKQGFIEVEPNGAFDFSYPSSLTRRGRVQGGGNISPTITCNPECIYVYEVIYNVSYKDSLAMETIIQDGEVFIKKERISKTKPKGEGWEYVECIDGRRAWVRIRKLTPRECFRLQGVREEKIDKLLDAGISDSQLYKLAGNSICVDCMVALFRNLYFPEEEEATTLF